MCHVIKESNSFKDGSLSLVSQQLAKFCDHGSSTGGYVVYLIYHVTSHDLAYEFIDGSSLQHVTTLISLVTIFIVIVEI